MSPEAETITGPLLEPPSTNGYADCATEGIAETTPEVFFASHSILQTGADKLESQVHDLEVTLSNERAEFKRAIAVLKEKWYTGARLL